MKKNTTLIFLFKVLVGLGILSFLLSRIDIGQFFRVLSSAQASYLVLALIAYFLGQIVSSLRWAVLAWPLGFKSRFKEFVAFYFIGMFFNLFAPGIVGGDVGRVFYLARAADAQGKLWTASTPSAIVSVVADRTIGLAVLAWMGAVALAVFPSYSLPWIIRILTFAVAFGFVLAWMLFPLASRFLSRRESLVGKRTCLALETYRQKQQVFLSAMLLSLTMHVIQAWIQILLGRALGVEIPWSYCFILYPLVGIFSALPITLNGLGLREGGYLFLLRHIGVDPEKAVAFGLLWFIIVALDSLIGGIVFVFRKGVSPAALASEMRESSKVAEEQG